MNYLGIDLGDGESAIAYLTEDSVIEPVIQTLSRQKSLLSIVGTLDGQAMIGEAALLTPDIQNLRARFKSRYLSDDAASADIRRFATGLYDCLGGLDQSDLRVALGVPAGWTEAERERYAGLIKDAGFKNLYTVSESRAAFLYCKHSHSLKLDAQMLSKPALVIDMGSSTTDFAYIVKGQEKRVGTFGHINLGGGLIDALILEDAVKAAENRERLEAVFEKEPSWAHFAELSARRLKEMYFLSEESAPFYDTVMIYYNDPPEALRFELTREKMQKLLNTPIDTLHGRSFSESLEVTLKDAVTATRADPPQIIVLTGGASRMAFFKDACQNAFPDALLTVAGEPEFTTAKGLCYAARIDHRIEQFQAEAHAYFESGKVRDHVDAHLNELASAIVPPLTDYILSSAVTPAVLSWRNGAGGSLAELEKRLGKQIETLLSAPETAEVTRPHIKAWSLMLISLVQRDLDIILKKCRLDLTLKRMDTLHANAAVDEVTLVLPGDGLSGIVMAVTGYITASLFGGSGTAVLVAAGLSNPLALLIGAVAGIVIGALGAAYGRQKAKETPLPLFLRKLIPIGLLKKTLAGDKQRGKLEASLYDVMTDRDGVFCQSLIKDIAGDLTRQLEAFQREEELPIR